MKEMIMYLVSTILIWGVVTGCSNQEVEGLKEVVGDMKTEKFNFNVNPETFELVFDVNDKNQIQVSRALERKEVADLEKTENYMAWKYPDENIEIELFQENEYVDVSIKSTSLDTTQFSWPRVAGDNYLLPINEGKSIPSDDQYWKDYFLDNEYDVIEYFSMQFFALSQGDHTLVFIIENPFNNTIKFDTKNEIEFTFTHEYPSINDEKEYGFRIYVTDNNPVSVANIYKNYLIEMNQFKTLEEKAAENSDIEKLYGAAFVYYWDESIICDEDINWNELRKKLSPTLKNWIQELLLTEVEEGQELALAFDTLIELDYTDKYTKNQIVKGLNAVMNLEEFYHAEVFPDVQGERNLNAVELIEFNKKLLKSSLGSVLAPIEEWAKANTIDVINEMYEAGLTKMWIGLDDWNHAFMNTNFIQTVNDLGYLIGSYDSYHSIHKPGLEQWETAKFEDETLYEQATIINEAGEKLTGFQGVGRKLNPTLSFPTVKSRLKKIMDTGVAFNSWFIDCDATGEIYDDYSINHPTTQKEDLLARLERMAYIRDTYDMVIGSEGGNDFANQTIAFAHGISTPEFSWLDKDMKNKDSEYYVGRYYSSYGGVPEIFSKQIPVKEEYKHIFMDMTYTIPLYKLVYNNSTITTHHWLWGTLKVADEVEERMLYEVAYNIPPLYHLDKYEWEKHKEEILMHTQVWSTFSEKAIQEEMTNFKVLSDDRLVQMLQYGEDLKVLVNFSKNSVTVDGQTLKAKSLMIFDGDEYIIYQPSFN